MTDQNDNVIEMPQIDPEATKKKVEDLVTKLDELPSDVTPRKLLDFLQDDLAPTLRTVYGDVMALFMYVNVHEDRLLQIEQGEPSLSPDEAQHLLDFVTESLKVFRRLAEEAKVPGLKELIKHGEECEEILADFVDEDDDQGEPPARKH